jgi:flagellar biosynthesis protein FlhB
MLRLDLQFFSGEKTEKATPNKRRETRNKGQVAKSQEVASALTFLLCFSFLMISGKSLFEGCLYIFRHTYQEYMLWDISLANTQVIFNQLLFNSVKLVVPIFAVVVIAGVVANYLQVGFMFNAEALKIKLEKLDPIQGAKNIFSIRSLVELLKSILKILMVSFVIYLVVWRKKELLFTIGERNIGDALRLIGSLIVQLGMTVAVILMVLAVADYIFQKYEFEKKIRMSKQDIKDEFKKMEGDPYIKGKRRAKQRELAMNRMIQEVPKADVVITNPTHFAIAIRYDFETMDAPIVIAKGQDLIALKIKEIAKENKIVMVENRTLARALFATVEIGEQIPEDLFNAVGEVLAYVYYQNGRYKGMRT